MTSFFFLRRFWFELQGSLVTAHNTDNGGHKISERFFSLEVKIYELPTFSPWKQEVQYHKCL